MAWKTFKPPGGVGKGDGWGGPARGASTSRIKPGDPDGIQAMSTDPDIKARQAERAAKLHDHLYGLATEADRQETQLAATIAYLDRVEGKPVARNDTRLSAGEGGPINFTWMPVAE